MFVVTVVGRVVVVGRAVVVVVDVVGARVVVEVGALVVVVFVAEAVVELVGSAVVVVGIGSGFGPEIPVSQLMKSTVTLPTVICGVMLKVTMLSSTMKDFIATVTNEEEEEEFKFWKLMNRATIFVLSPPPLETCMESLTDVSRYDVG